jgi:hypothetical protein
VVAGDDSGGLTGARRSLESLPAERYPRLAEAVGSLSEDVPPDACAAFGLGLLRAGIEATAGRSA